MNKKISPELLEKLEGGGAETGEVPVIVTLAQGADPVGLEQQGMKIRRTFDNVPAVAGSVATGHVNDLARLEQVERIEYDGEIHTL